MEKKDLIERNDLESLGKWYLTKAVDFTLESSFGKAYEFIKEGLDLLTCDCGIGGWRRRFDDYPIEFLNDLEVKVDDKAEYYFVKSFFLIYSDENKEKSLALDSIDRYLELREDEYGIYLKGKILYALGLYQEALEMFEFSRKFSDNPRIKYRIGRVKEQHLGQFGMDMLFASFSENPSSSCCVRELMTHTHDNEIKLEVSESTSNSLLNFFCRSEAIYEIKFTSMYETYWRNATPVSETALNEFIAVLKNNQQHYQVEDEDDFEAEVDYF
jgi:hypothetical protein